MDSRKKMIIVGERSPQIQRYIDLAHRLNMQVIDMELHELATLSHEDNPVVYINSRTLAEAPLQGKKPDFIIIDDMDVVHDEIVGTIKLREAECLEPTPIKELRSYRPSKGEKRRNRRYRWS